MNDNANSRQVGGVHYKSASGVQHWDMVLAAGIRYLPAQISRYLCRWQLKNGLEDLKKAEHYAQKWLETPALSAQEPGYHTERVVAGWLAQLDAPAAERRLLLQLLTAETIQEVEHACKAVSTYVAEASAAVPTAGYVDQDDPSPRTLFWDGSAYASDGLRMLGTPASPGRAVEWTLFRWGALLGRDRDPAVLLARFNLRFEPNQGPNP